MSTRPLKTTTTTEEPITQEPLEAQELEAQETDTENKTPEEDSISEEEENLSPEDQKEILNYNPEESISLDNQLRMDLDEEEPNERRPSEKGSIKFTTVAIGVGLVIGLGALLWYFLFKKEPTPQVTQEIPEETQPELPIETENTEELNKTRAQLARVGQQQDQENPDTEPATIKQTEQEDPIETTELPEQELQQPEPQPEPPSRPRPRPEPRVITRTVEVPAPRRKPEPSPQRPVFTPPPSPSPPAQPPVQFPAQPPAQKTTTPPPPPEPQEPEIPPEQRWNQLAQLGTQALNAPTLEEGSTNETSQEDSTNEPSQGLSGILQKRPVPEEPTPKQVIIGTTTKGSVVIPLATTLSQPSEFQRFAIKLTAPLQANEGVALNKGDILIAEVTQLSESLLVLATAIAAIKENNEGLAKTIEIEPNKLLIRGPRNSALIARRDSQPLITGGDLAGAGAGALGNVGEVLTEPETITSITTSNNSAGGSSTTVNSQSNNPDNRLLPAALEGFFTPLSESIQTRQQQRRQRRLNQPNIVTIDKGTQVSIVANENLTISN